MAVQMRKPKDRDYVRTVEGLFFCLVGYLHPQDAYTAYLKYVPSEKGIWGRLKRYERALSYYHVSKVVETFDLLKEKYPHYMRFCPVRSITMSMVPIRFVEEYYRPEERLRDIKKRGFEDPLEEDMLNLVNFLHLSSGVSVDSFGVTGSILIGLHNPSFSDIDLTIYGLKEARRVKELLREALKDGTIVKRPLNDILAKSAERLKVFHLNFNELLDILMRRWNYGVFKGRRFSIHPIRRDEEIAEEYGNYLYITKAISKVKAEVEDASESMFLPAIYHIRVIDGDVNAKEVISYEGLFSDVAEEGDLIEVCGKVEEVRNADGDSLYNRIVIGAAEVPNAYMRILKRSER